jgi:rhamnosyltransferase
MIDILMATFNGAKHVEVQLLSLIGQDYRDWRLLVHDDGSSDHTVEIVRRWAAVDPRIQLVEDGVRCGGAARNFMHLLTYSTAPYVMFCDQDDVWLDCKVGLMYEAMIQENMDKPTIVYSNSYVWNPTAWVLGKATPTFPQDLRSFLFLNSGMQGCVALFNARMRALMLWWEGDLAMHDHLLHLIGLSIGRIVYLPLPLMLYRQHEANVTGGTRTTPADLVSIHRNIRRPVVCRLHYCTVEKFLDRYGELLDALSLDVLHCYLRMPGMTFAGRLLSAWRYRFRVYGSMLWLTVKLIVKPYIN